MSILSDCAHLVRQRLRTAGLTDFLVETDPAAVRVRVWACDDTAHDFSITHNEASYAFFPSVDALLDAARDAAQS